jgi:aminobenzoyl-glutamate transport protein
MASQSQIGDILQAQNDLAVFAPVVVTFAQRYQKHSGVGAVVALMLPVSAAVLVTWLSLLILWFVSGIPLGPGYPVRL